MVDKYERVIRCSFCSKTQDDGVILVAGPGVFICEECIALCNEIIAEKKGRLRPSRIMATANFPCGSMGEEVSA